MNSVIQQMGTQNIARIRVGVDRPADPRHSQIDWVLGRFTKEEQPIIEQTIKRAAEAVESHIPYWHRAYDEHLQHTDGPATDD